MQSRERRAGQRADDRQYVIRELSPSDAPEFLSLYRTVFGKERDADWFDWRYAGPFSDRARVVVVEADGELVGAEPFISIPIRAGDDTVVALQPADAMVHADHRRRGLLTRMTEHALDRYADREPALVFNFPNPAAEPVYLRLGWSSVGTVATYYRVQNPSAVVAGGVGGALGRGSTPFARGYLGARDRLSRAARGVDVERRDAVPAALLESLYERRVPEELHAHRTATFYRWRFANPNWECHTYVAHRRGDPVAALVACTQTVDGATVTKVMDLVPTPRAARSPGAASALLAALLDDRSDADLVAAAAPTLPHDVAARHGFHRDDAFPLSAFCSPTPMVARPLGADSPVDFRVAERDRWHPSFVEQDASY